MAKEPLVFAGQSPKGRGKCQETELGALEAKGTCQNLPAPLRGAVPLISDLLLDLMNYLMPELWIVMEITHLMKDTNRLYSKPARCSDQIPDTCRQSSRAHPNSLLRNNDNEAALNLGDIIQSIETHMCGQRRMFCRPKCCPVAIPPSSLWGERVVWHTSSCPRLTLEGWSLGMACLDLVKTTPVENPPCVGSEHRGSQALAYFFQDPPENSAPRALQAVTSFWSPTCQPSYVTMRLWEHHQVRVLQSLLGGAFATLGSISLEVLLEKHLSSLCQLSP